MPGLIFLGYCHEAYYQRTSPSHYQETGTEYQDIAEIFPSLDNDDYHLQCPVSLFDDF
jgi:hypothetical protein